MSRKIQEDLIFPEKIFHCNVCNVDNAYFVIIKPFGQAVWGGTVCNHADRTKIGQNMKKIDAEHFLKIERHEAEDFCVKADASTKESIQHFISDINAALIRMRAY